MGDRARKLMTVEEFLEWDDGTDTRYQLIDGVAVAMAPTFLAHGVVSANVVAEVDRRLAARPPCRAVSEAGLPRTRLRFYVADIAATREPVDGRRHIEAPFLLVEVLSRSTRDHDLEEKLADYKALQSVHEIWLVDSERRWVQVWQRGEEGWEVLPDLVGGAAFDSLGLGDRISLDRLYRNTPL